MELSEGYAVGPYRLVSRAGSGGMADVWRAHDARLKRYVAIKFLSPRYATDEQYLERFRREAQAISRLDHPNILAIYDYGEQDGWTYMVSPFIGGGTLAPRLRRGPWTVQEAVAVLDPLATALDYAHGEGVVHRDVKPSNVLFTDRGRLVLSDFGIARMIEGSTLLSQAGLVVGTPMYMSPEQADGQRVTGSSDLYSLGVIAYEMLTGRPPFMAETPLALLRAHIDKPLPPPRKLNRALSESIEATLFTIMAKDPADRFSSGQAFIEALREAATQPAPKPDPASPDPHTDPTLPLDASDSWLDHDTQISDLANDKHRRLSIRPTPPLVPPPLDPTVPLSRDEFGTDRAISMVVPLAIMVVGWVIAWVPLMILRSLRYEPVASLLGLEYPGLPGAFLSIHLIAAAGIGFVGGAGVAIALHVARVTRGWRSGLMLSSGWALGYALVHAIVYQLAINHNRTTVLSLDEYLALFGNTYLSWEYNSMRPIDILPAALGGLVSMYVLRRDIAGQLALRLILGWTLAAMLALLVAWLVVRADDIIFVGVMMDGPRRNGLTLGVVAGIVQGVVGGWITLTGLRRSS